MHTKSQPRRQAIVWGALWGPALGFCFAGPFLLRSHRLTPQRWTEWFTLDLVLLIAFVVLGALLSFSSCVFLVAWEAIRRRPFRNPAWAYGLAVGLLLPAAYVVVIAVLEVFAFKRMPSAEWYGPIFFQLSAIYAEIGAVTFLGYRFVTLRVHQPSAGVLRVLLVATTCTGVVMLPARIESALTVSREVPRLTPAAPTPSRPLLFVGLDSGNWQVLGPLLERGALPTFRQLVTHGMQGEMRASWPPYWSAPAWAAIVTGYGREETGVYEDLAASVPGLPPFQVPLVLDPRLEPALALETGLAQVGLIRMTSMPRAVLHRPPFWERLAGTGRKAAVVRFSFTVPAAGRASLVVSDWVGHDTWELMGAKSDEMADVVAPREEAAELVAAFAERHSDHDLLAQILPSLNWPKPADAALDPTQFLRVAANLDQQTFDATARLLRSHRDLATVAVYLGGFDTVCHAFWAYRFPGEFRDHPPAARDVEALGSVIDRYAEFLDRGLARVLAAFPVPPNVMIVADHGHEATHNHPLWRGWHGARGLFVLGGPDIPVLPRPREAVYDDVVPTVLDLLGFAAAPDLRGVSLLRQVHPSESR